jgi:hypothetical protein
MAEHGNEPTLYFIIKDDKFLGQLTDYRLLKKDCAAWSCGPLFELQSLQHIQ